MAAAAVFSQLIVVLFVLLTTAGSSDVFRVVGVSVQLEIKESASEFDDFFWTFSGSVTVLKYYKKCKDVTLSPHYEHRVEFNDKTCSLNLKNLQKNDSGPYKVEASNALQTTTLYTYILSVLDAVEPPVLTLYNTTDPCNVTLTCRGHDLSINSTCYKETCEEKEVTSPGGVALSLSVRDGVIICNYSNLVSWKQDKITFTHLCPDTASMAVHAGSHWTGILITVCFLVFLGFLVVGYRKIQQRRSADSRRMEMENTLYAEVETSDQPLSPETRLKKDSAVYSTVNSQHPSNKEKRHITEIKKPVPASVTVEPSKPESLYSEITKNPVNL